MEAAEKAGRRIGESGRVSCPPRGCVRADRESRQYPENAGSMRLLSRDFPQVTIIN